MEYGSAGCRLSAHILGCSLQIVYFRIARRFIDTPGSICIQGECSRAVFPIRINLLHFFLPHLSSSPWHRPHILQQNGNRIDYFQHAIHAFRIILSRVSPSRVNSRTFWRPRILFDFERRFHPCSHKSTKSLFAGRCASCKPFSPLLFPFVPPFLPHKRIRSADTRYTVDTSASAPKEILRIFHPPSISVVPAKSDAVTFMGCHYRAVLFFYVVNS